MGWMNIFDIIYDVFVLLWDSLVSWIKHWVTLAISIMSSSCEEFDWGRDSEENKFPSDLWPLNHCWTDNQVASCLFPACIRYWVLVYRFQSALNWHSSWTLVDRQKNWSGLWFVALLNIGPFLCIEWQFPCMRLIHIEVIKHSVGKTKHPACSYLLIVFLHHKLLVVLQFSDIQH